MSYEPSFTAQGTFTPDNLQAGDFPVKVKSVTLKAGTSYVRGTVLEAGVSGDAGKYLAVTTDANAKYVLLEDVDATSAAKTGNVAITGEFNGSKLTLGSGATLAGVTAALEPLSIFVRGSVA